MEKRKPITAAMKLAALRTYAKVLCYRCQQFYILGSIQFDHEQARCDLGKHEVGNIKPICIGCHKEKTRFEVKRLKKSDRLAKARAVHEQIVKGEAKREQGSIKSRPFDKRWRRRLDGRVERAGNERPEHGVSPEKVS